MLTPANLAKQPAQDVLSQHAAGAEPRPAVRYLALRVTLQLLLLSLLLLTAVALGALSFVSRQTATENLVGQILRGATKYVAAEVKEFLEPGPRTLTDLTERATYGRLPVDDPDRLAEYLADRLRYERTISQLMYGDVATGAVVGAVRDDDGQIAIVQDNPNDTDGARAWLINVDGTRLPYPGALPRELDARERPWFQGALAAAGRQAWVGPFTAVNGESVLAVAGGFSNAGSQVLKGVWAAQFYLDHLPDVLREAADERPNTQVLLLGREGRLIASAQPIVAERVVAARDALPVPVRTMPIDTQFPVRFTYQDESWAGGIQGFQVGGGLDWFVGFYEPEASFMQAVYESQKHAVAAAVVLLALALVLGTFIAARIAQPLRLIADDLARVALFQLSPTPAPRSLVKEVAVVADAVDRMKASLRSFGRYIPTEIVRDLLARGEEARLGGETRCLTIHFSDIEGFTHLSEHLAPTEVVEYLAEYLDCMSDTIRDGQGTIDKFIGDGIMAFWNAPNALPDHAARACRAALAAQTRLAELRVRWRALGQPEFRARIGLHTGEAIVGNFGTPDRFAYTAMGDSVNLASRLEGQNKAYGTYILASESVRAAAGADFEWRWLDRVAVVGRTEGTAVYELLGERLTIEEGVLEARDRYERALADYFARRFDEAATGFQAAAAARPDDKAAPMMARRAASLSSYPPPPDWNGVYVSSSK